MRERTIEGITISFEQVTGEVVSTNASTQTHITSSGGGGSIHMGTGTISAPKIRSHNTTTQEVWIRSDDGHEHRYVFTNADAQVRPSQRVTVLTYYVSGNSGGEVARVFNHSSRQAITIHDDAAASEVLAARFKQAKIQEIESKTNRTLYNLSMVGWLIAIIFLVVTGFIIIAGPIIAIYYWGKFKRFKGAIAKAVDTAMEFWTGVVSEADRKFSAERSSR